ncbi:Metabotropic glutamate receptor 2 [Portunus trituberculatus]|uniref:Metabotropic glutamate receptor 2 n=1 Tax=Portunus trituberculatus TaxID=210409 RepID=A0A5B7FME3_PORTR|nr:Metabotropic glutamate receptor 2 [Portunus trituberculatus]
MHFFPPQALSTQTSTDLLLHKHSALTTSINLSFISTQHSYKHRYLPSQALSTLTSIQHSNKQLYILHKHSALPLTLPPSLPPAGIFSTVLVGIIFWVHLETPVIKAASRELSYILLGGILLSFLMSFIIVAPPNKISCGLTRFFLGFSYSVCYAAVLTKISRISRIFNSTHSKKSHKCPDGFNEARYITFTNYTTCIIWLIFVPLYLSAGVTDDIRVVTLALSLSLGCVRQRITSFVVVTIIGYLDNGFNASCSFATPHPHPDTFFSLFSFFSFSFSR